MVPSGRRFVSLETESAVGWSEDAKAPQFQARNAKTPWFTSTGFSVNRLAAQFRDQDFSSPSWTRTGDWAVNSLDYQPARVMS